MIKLCQQHIALLKAITQTKVMPGRASTLVTLYLLIKEIVMRLSHEINNKKNYISTS